MVWSQINVQVPSGFSNVDVNGALTVPPVVVIVGTAPTPQSLSVLMAMETADTTRRAGCR